MKNFLLSVLLLLCGSLSFVACDDDDEVFEGTDNRILSLVLTAQDGSIYHGAIVEDEIVFSIPDNVSLEGVTVKYEISEQATLFPAPESVTNWDQEQTFRVTSYNKSERDYTCKVVRLAVSANSVILNNQADVDAFAAQSVTVIEGNLIIGGFSHTSGDSITDLSALAGITDVRYNLVINNSFNGTELSMPALKTLGGLVLGNAQTSLNTSKKIEVELPALESLGQLSVNSSSISTLSLPSVKMIGDIYIYSGSLAELDLSSLTECAGNLTLASASYNGTNNNLKTLDMPLLENLKGTFKIEYMKGISSMNFSKLKDIAGDCSMNNVGVEQIQLPALQNLGGSLSFTGMNNLVKVDLSKLENVKNLSMNDYNSIVNDVDFTALKEVNGDLKVNFSGESLSFPALKKVQGIMELKKLDNLTGLHLSNLTECKSICISDAKLMTSMDFSTIDKIESLEIIASYKLAEIKVKENALNNVTLNGGSKECDFTHFVGTDHINGKLSISNYSQNAVLDFPGLKRINSFSENSGSSNGQTLNFPDLEKISEFQIVSGTWLKEINAPKLKEVGTWKSSFTSKIQAGDLKFPLLNKIGYLELEGGTWSGSFDQMILTSLDDFSSVKEITKVKITGWGHLVDFSGLQNVVTTITAENWIVQDCAYNPTLDDMKEGRYVKADE